MNTFEQQAADAIRNLGIAIAILAVAIVVVCGLATWGLLSAQSDSTKLVQEQKALKASVQSPTHVRDIAYWCNFDVALKGDLDAYLGRLKAPTLPLPPLNCAAIEHTSRAAAK